MIRNQDSCDTTSVSSSSPNPIRTPSIEHNVMDLDSLESCVDVSSSRCVLEDFDYAVTSYIFSYLDLSSINSLFLTSKGTKKAADSDLFWKSMFEERWNHKLYPPHHVCKQNSKRNEEAQIENIKEISSKTFWKTAFKNAFTHSHDLWICHWNCVSPVDGEGDGRTCIQENDYLESSIVNDNKKISQDYPRISSQYFKLRDSAIRRELDYQQKEQCGELSEVTLRRKKNIHFDPVMEARDNLVELKEGEETELTEDTKELENAKHLNEVITRRTHLTLQYSLAKWCRHMYKLKLLQYMEVESTSDSGIDEISNTVQQKSIYRNIKAFRKAATLSREINICQYQSNQLNFLTDALFFTTFLKDEQGDDYNTDDNQTPGPNNKKDFHKYHHSWHIAKLINPSYFQPITYRVLIQRPDFFSVFPSEGILLPGQVTLLYFSVKNFGSSVACTDETILPKVPFVIRYMYAPTVPPCYSHDPSLLNSERRITIREPATTRNNNNINIRRRLLVRRIRKKKRLKSLVESMWDRKATLCENVQSIFVSGHVNSNYSLVNFQQNTLFPYDLRSIHIVDDNSTGDKTRTSRSPLTFHAPYVQHQTNSLNTISSIAKGDKRERHSTCHKNHSISNTIVNSKSRNAIVFANLNKLLEEEFTVGRRFILRKLICDYQTCVQVKEMFTSIYGHLIPLKVVFRKAVMIYQFQQEQELHQKNDTTKEKRARSLIGRFFTIFNHLSREIQLVKELLSSLKLHDQRLKSEYYINLLRCEEYICHWENYICHAIQEPHEGGKEDEPLDFTSFLLEKKDILVSKDMVESDDVPLLCNNTTIEDDECINGIFEHLAPSLDKSLGLVRTDSNSNQYHHEVVRGHHYLPHFVFSDPLKSENGSKPVLCKEGCMNREISHSNGNHSLMQELQLHQISWNEIDPDSAELFYNSSNKERCHTRYPSCSMARLIKTVPPPGFGKNIISIRDVQGTNSNASALLVYPERRLIPIEYPTTFFPNNNFELTLCTKNKYDSRHNNNNNNNSTQVNRMPQRQQQQRQRNAPLENNNNNDNNNNNNNGNQPNQNINRFMNIQQPLPPQFHRQSPYSFPFILLNILNLISILLGWRSSALLPNRRNNTHSQAQQWSTPPPIIMNRRMLIIAQSASQTLGLFLPLFWILFFLCFKHNDKAIAMTPLMKWSYNYYHNQQKNHHFKLETAYKIIMDNSDSTSNSTIYSLLNQILVFLVSCMWDFYQKIRLIKRSYMVIFMYVANVYHKSTWLFTFSILILYWIWNIRFNHKFMGRTMAIQLEQHQSQISSKTNISTIRESLHQRRRSNGGIYAAEDTVTVTTGGAYGDRLFLTKTKRKNWFNKLFSQFLAMKKIMQTIFCVLYGFFISSSLVLPSLPNRTFVNIFIIFSGGMSLVR